MNKEQLLAHMKVSNPESFQSKFKREQGIELGDYCWIGYRLYLRGFSTYEIRTYLYGE